MSPVAARRPSSRRPDFFARFPSDSLPASAPRFTPNPRMLARSPARQAVGFTQEVSEPL